MQPSQLMDGFVSRPQEKVIGIAQENLDVEIVQLIGRHRLDRCLRTHRHENGCLYNSVPCMQTAAPRVCIGILREQLEYHGI